MVVVDVDLNVIISLSQPKVNLPLIAGHVEKSQNLKAYREPIA
jgi:hypothetical protein